MMDHADINTVYNAGTHYSAAGRSPLSSKWSPVCFMDPFMWLPMVVTFFMVWFVQSSSLCSPYGYRSIEDGVDLLPSHPLYVEG